MTDLQRLDVSLTKFGAHKLGILLRKYDASSVLKHIWDSEPGVNIDESVARKTLSASSTGVVPNVWNEARAIGPQAVDALLLISIIFSHHRLISTLQTGAGENALRGRFVRGRPLNDKEFTNLATAFDALGQGTKRTFKTVDYDFRTVVSLKGFASLVVELLKLKLLTAKWDGHQSILEELIALKLHRVFAMDERGFVDWLTQKPLSRISLDVANFFVADDDTAAPSSFAFLSGHRPKLTGRIGVHNQGGEVVADLLHNAMQNGLYLKLVQQFGKPNVGTELPTGFGTFIDVVVRTTHGHWYYEIKTARSVKACVRQALPQLLEYAYWHGSKDRCERMIIVGPKPITEGAKRYLKFLRDTFGLQIYYEDFDIDTFLTSSSGPRRP